MKEKDLFNQKNTAEEKPEEELKEEDKKEQKEESSNNEEVKEEERENKNEEKDQESESTDKKEKIIEGIKKASNGIDDIVSNTDLFAQHYESKINIKLKTPEQREAKEEIISLLDILETHSKSLEDIKKEFDKLLDNNRTPNLGAEEIKTLAGLYESQAEKEKNIDYVTEKIKEEYKKLEGSTEEKKDLEELSKETHEEEKSTEKNKETEEEKEYKKKVLEIVDSRSEHILETMTKSGEIKKICENYINEIDLQNETQKNIKEELTDSLLPELDQAIVSLDDLRSELDNFYNELSKEKINGDHGNKLADLNDKVKKAQDKIESISSEISVKVDELTEAVKKDDKEKEVNPKKETENIENKELIEDINFQLNIVADKLKNIRHLKEYEFFKNEYDNFLGEKDNISKEHSSENSQAFKHDKLVRFFNKIKVLRNSITSTELENGDIYSLGDYSDKEKMEWRKNQDVSLQKNKKREKIANSVYEAVSSVAGINIFHTLPQYLKQKKSIKNTDNTITNILNQNNKILWENREGETVTEKSKSDFKDSWQSLHRILNNMEGGEKKHSNVRKKMASILKEFRFHKENSEEEQEKINEKFTKELNSLMENFVSTKTSSMKVKKEAVNTAVRASQFVIPAAGIARVALYSGLELKDRKNKMTREKIQEQDLKGEKIEKEDSKETKTSWKEALKAGIKETYQGAIFAGEKGKKGKGSRAFKSYMHILRYVGIAAMGVSTFETDSEGAEELANKAIEKAEGGGIAENFMSRLADVKSSIANSSFMESASNFFAEKPELNLDTDLLSKYGLSPEDVDEKSELLELDLDGDKTITANDIRLLQEQKMDTAIETNIPLSVEEMENIKELNLPEGQAITDEVLYLAQNDNFNIEQMNVIVANPNLLSNTEVLENMHPSILNQVLENGALEDKDVVLDELLKEKNLNDDELSALMGSNLDNKAEMIDKLNELRSPETIIKEGGNFTSALSSLLNESSEKVQDAFINRVNEEYDILKDGEELTSANREELLNKAINRLSVEGANPDSGVANYVHEGNTLKIDAETGEWELEQDEAEYGPQAKDMSSGEETAEEDFNFMEKVKDEMGINYGDKVIPRTFIEEQGFEDTNLSPDEAAQVNEDFDKLSEAEKDHFIKDNIRLHGSEEAIKELSRLEGEEIAQSGTEVESDIEARTGSGDDSFVHESNDVEEDLVREEVVTDTEEPDNIQEDLNNTETEPESDSSREQSSAGEGSGVENETTGEKEIPDIFMKDLRGVNERAGLSEGFGSDPGQNFVEEKWEDLSEASKEWYYNYSDNMKSLEVGDASEKVNALRNLLDIKDTHSLNMEDGKFVLDNDTKFEILEGSFKYVGSWKEITPENISDIRRQLGLDR